MIEKDSRAGVDFLKLFHPDAPWVLTSIDPDKKAIQTQTFTPAQEADALAWIERFNGVRNLYFSVGVPTRALSKKAEREDIQAVTYLHVDLDPRAGEDLDEERERILKLLRNPPGLPKPTFIVFSGGGYQGFWRLEDPIVIGGDLSKAEDAKRHNLQIELLLGGDNTHNVDRIMRIPGTVNIPDARKRKKGREPALAVVVEHDPEAVYPCRLFPQAPEVQTSEDTGFSAKNVQVSGNIQRLGDVDELPESVPGRIKVMIVQGHDPDEPHKYGSRSENLFAVTVALVRAGVDDNTIYSVITDPDFQISESVLDKKRPEKYALRQIERAHEEAIHPKLRELNERHAVIGDMGGKCRVISEVFDPAMKRSKVSRQSFEDFRNRYMHISVELGVDKDGKPVKKKLGHWWLENPLHRHYETICFAPGQEIEGAYNLWKGFACESRPGDPEPFLHHIRENICSGNEEHYRYVLGWMARVVQRPDTAGETAIVLRGRMGTGKGVFIRNFGSLFGRHFLQVTDPKHLVGSFNSHLRDCVVLYGDEAFYAGDKKHESILKTLITEPFIQFEAKGVDLETGPNYTHILMSSNENWVVPVGGDDRRYFIMDVGDSKMKDMDYFRRLQHHMDNGGREALLHFLLTYDLSSFEVRKVPKTDALQEQKLLSLSPEEEWWYGKLQDGRLLANDVRWETSIEKDDLFNDFYTYMQKLGSYRRATKTALLKFLERVCPTGFPHTKQRWVEKEYSTPDGWKTTKKERPYFYEFPDLAACRARWDSKFGGADGVWPELNAEDAQVEMAEAKAEVPF